MPIPFPILALDALQMQPVPVKAHEPRDQQLGAVARRLGGEGLVQEQGVADGPVQDAVEDVGEGLALVVIPSAAAHGECGGRGESYDQVLRLANHFAREILLVGALEDLQDFAEVLVGADDDDVDHGRFAALLGGQGPVEVLHVAPHEVDGEWRVFFLSAPLEREQDGRAELVGFQLRFHALFQRVAVTLVAEGVFDGDDVGVGAAHEAFDQEFASRRVGLVPEVRPVRFAFPAAEGGGVGHFAEVAGHFQLDVLGDVDAFALDFDVLFVLDP